MYLRPVPLLFLICCAAFLAAAHDARGEMTIRELPLNRTAAWEQHVALLQRGPSPNIIPPLRISSATVPVAPVSWAAVPAGEVPNEWLERIRLASTRHGLDEALLTAVIKVESNFDSYAMSPKGARGVMQIMPDTGRALGLENFFDPDANLDAGAAYLASLLREFSRPELALAAYNAGPDAVRRHGGLPPYAETQNYVDRVLTLFKQYRVPGR